MNALIIVDVQYDFMPGGALAVAEGDKVADVILKIRDRFDHVVFTQDWHPADHCSFRQNGGIWPPHCIQNSDGASIDRKIFRDGDTYIRKGIHQDVDSYSGFWDNERKHKTGLDDHLKTSDVDTIYICGLATDYCVKFTALDGIDAGYRVFLIKDACRGVDVHEGDSSKAVDDMINKGVIVISSESIQ
ncbi:MAG: bifunctional nicotinamidase/pyrazinamidase [Chitinispirillaceae bacterium]|nr:bifunctional nicotinamidase/pyrazinamidase [Chitinispirillaceae bacterium]